MTYQLKTFHFIIKLSKIMATLNVTQKVEALENALRHYKFDDKYFIQSVNGGRKAKFAIAQSTESGGVDCQTNFMTHEELNGYMRGYFRAINAPLNMFG